MKRTNWKAPVIIIAAFLMGISINIAVRQFLPRFLPESAAGGADLIAVIAQILVSRFMSFVIVDLL